MDRRTFFGGVTAGAVGLILPQISEGKPPDKPVLEGWSDEDIGKKINEFSQKDTWLQMRSQADGNGFRTGIELTTNGWGLNHSWTVDGSIIHLQTPIQVVKKRIIDIASLRFIKFRFNDSSITYSRMKDLNGNAVWLLPSRG